MIPVLLAVYGIIALWVFIGQSEYHGVFTDYPEEKMFINAIIWPILLPIILVKVIIWLVWNSLKRIKEVICG